MSDLAFTRSGHGEPLVLLHGLGCDRQSWDPVLPTLAEHFDVIAIDMPGFGDSAPVPAHVEPTPALLATKVAAQLDEMGIPEAHVVGNSLGGWVALELAAIWPVRSVTLLSPAGLWRRGTPSYCRISLRLSRWFAFHAERPLSFLMRFGLARAVVLGQTHGHPMRMPAARARSVIRAMARSTGFDATLRATLSRRYVSTGPIEAPVTVAFGSRDVLLLRSQSRHLDELPASTRTAELPGGGHLPMSDNPDAVVEIIRTTALPAPAIEELQGRS